jgi:S-adenosylmethionine decarboxylase
MDKITLHGFNNLTKTLSFNIYDICYAKSAAHQKEYIKYIDEVYNADRLTEILKEVANIIGADILNISSQDYDPQGASVTMLVAEHPIDEKSHSQAKKAEPGPLPEDLESLELSDP